MINCPFFHIVEREPLELSMASSIQWQNDETGSSHKKKGNAGRVYYDGEQGTCHLIVLLFVIDGGWGDGVITQRTHTHTRARFTYCLNGGDGSN